MLLRNLKRREFGNAEFVVKGQLLCGCESKYRFTLATGVVQLVANGGGCSNYVATSERSL